MTGLVCRYFRSASILLIIKSVKIIKCAKISHSVCSGGLDVAELCASAPINIVEIVIFGRTVVIEGQEFDMFCIDLDPVDDIQKLFKK